MKILAIRIRNLASLEGTTEIDFTAQPLCTAGIFAITGATGAGKSTILDALCLALYGKTPRYLQARETGIEIRDVQGSTLSQGDVRSILRDGTAEGFAEVDFRGTDGQHYRARWSVRRARNKAEGSMQSDSVTLSNLTLASEIPGKKQETLNEIARLVGLSFDQFTRSVLLAQGDFTAFMKASRDEKASLLEKLTGTSVYSEISRKIYEKHKYEEQLLRELELRKAGIVTFTVQELQALQTELHDLEQQMATFEKTAEILAKEMSWHHELVRLHAYLEEAEIKLRQAGEKKAAALHRKEKLYLVEQVQQTRSIAHALSRAQQLHKEKAASLDLLQETLAGHLKNGEQLEAQLSSSELQLAEKTEEYSAAGPLLEKARQLDTLLAEKKEQAALSAQEAEAVTEHCRQHILLLENKRNELTAISEKMAFLSGWQTDHADRRSIAENRDLILSKLQDAGKFPDLLQSATSGLHQAESRIAAARQEKTALEAEWQKQLDHFDGLRKNYNTREEKLLSVPINILEQEKADADLKREALLDAHTVWHSVFILIQETDALRDKLRHNEDDYSNQKKICEELHRQLPLANERKETAGKILKQARLALAENVETLRSELADNEPCPVCGSISHPYATRNPQLDYVLSGLEKEYTEQEQHYLDMHRQHSIKEEECRSLQQAIDAQSEELLSKSRMLEQKRQDWSQLPAAQESKPVADGDKLQWLADQAASLLAERNRLAAQITSFSFEKQQLENDKKVMEDLKDTTTELSDKIRDLTAQLALLQEQNIRLAKERDQAAAGLQETEKVLSPYFTAAGWMDKWKTAPAAFTERIHAFAGQWKENTERQEKLAYEKTALQATLAALEDQEKNMYSELEKKKENHERQTRNLLEIQKERNLLFEGRSAEAVEKGLKQTLTNAREQHQQIMENRQNLLLETARLNAKKEESANALVILEKEAETALHQLESWLNGYNCKNAVPISLQELHELLAFTHEWTDTERKFLQSVDEEATRVASVFEERKEAFSSHQEKRFSGRPVEEITRLLEEAKAETEQKRHKKGEISFRMQQDENNRRKIGNLLQDIEAQASISENWSRLNEMIGSADGKKFRQMAQEYTLDALLGYANIHLQSLTGRYRIERIPATLGLQVVDQDMGDEVRTVYSLSGGESFLVSLALALGLASLSSNRMKVESLFIDEGFGSLDPNTLNIAMDALERLHHQGRKVGVISHVQEMTERIPVQIRVSKKQSGKSKVEITGC